MLSKTMCGEEYQMSFRLIMVSVYQTSCQRALELFRQNVVAQHLSKTIYVVFLLICHPLYMRHKKAIYYFGR